MRDLLTKLFNGRASNCSSPATRKAYTTLSDSVVVTFLSQLGYARHARMKLPRLLMTLSQWRSRKEKNVKNKGVEQ